MISRIAVAVALLGAGCQGERPELVTVRDSAGVRIVENRGPSWPANESWRVSSEPTFDLDSQDDDDLYRLASPRRLPDGRVAVYNGGSCEVRIYDETARLLEAWGRCGEGPGEFDALRGFWSWRGDSLLIVDQRPARVSIFDHTGRLGRTAMVPTDEDLPLPSVQGVLADGSLVLTGVRDPAGRPTPGVDTAQTTLAVAQSLDQPPTVLGIFTGVIWDYGEIGGIFTRTRLPFSGSTRFAITPSQIVVGIPDGFELRTLSPTGDLISIARGAFDPTPVMPKDIDWLLQRRLGEVEGSEAQRAVRRAFRDLRHAEAMPAFGVPIWPGGAEGGPAMLADHDGNVWLFHHYRPGEYQNRWTVFSPDGVWLGAVTLPRGLRP